MTVNAVCTLALHVITCRGGWRKKIHTAQSESGHIVVDVAERMSFSEVTVRKYRIITFSITYILISVTYQTNNAIIHYLTIKKEKIKGIYTNIDLNILSGYFLCKYETKTQHNSDF